MANVLTDPPFAADPPIKLNVNAKILGLVIGILAIIGLVIALLALPVVFALNNICNNLIGGTCSTGIFGLALIGVIITVVGELLYAIGGFQMYNMNRAGKDKVIYGLAINVVGGILQIVGYGGVGGFIFALIVAVIVYYLVVISRFPGEMPLVASGGYGAPPPPPPA